MKKAALSYVALVSLVIPTILFTHTPALACDDREPITLLELYRFSDGIHVATFRGIEEGKERREEGESYSIIDQKKLYDVSSTLKGKAVKVVTLEEQRYIYHEPEPTQPEGSEPEEAPIIEDGHSEEPETVEFKPGDEVLVFLKKNKESGKVETTDSIDGVKKLTQENRSSYIARIKELKPIFAAKKLDNEKILDWLIRCAEDSATRWEGTYELQRSFWSHGYRQERLARGEQVDADSEEDSLGAERPEYAAAMTEYHRQALTNIVINGGMKAVKKAGKNDGNLVAGDAELINLVSRWGNAHLAGNFLNHVQSGSYEAHENAQMMTAIAAILKDSALEKLAVKFNDNAYYADTDIVEEDSPDGDEEETESEAETESVGGEAVEQPDNQEETGEPAGQKKLTYKELRMRLSDKFIARANALLSEPKAASVAAVARANAEARLMAGLPLFRLALL